MMRLTTCVFFVCCILGGIPTSIYGQPRDHVTMHRGLIAHSIYNQGFSGKFDTHTKHTASSFAFPLGRSLRVYSGGSDREAWNAKSNSAGEGLWILSRIDGQKHVSVVGSETVSNDVVGLAHTPSAWPEGYAGVVHHEEYALASRTHNGGEAWWTDGVNLHQVRTNWWRSEGGIDSPQNPSRDEPLVIWNFRFNEYNSGVTYAERIRQGELLATDAPAWAEELSDDDFPEVVGITRAQSNVSGLMWTRKWYQWGHPEYDEFLINETVVENGSGQVREGVYVVIQNRFWQSSSSSWRDGYQAWSQPYDWSRDNHARSTLARNYLEGFSRDEFLNGLGKPAGVQKGKDLAMQGHPMLYAHDGESFHFSNIILDVGDPYQYARARERYTREQPWVREGFLNHSQYFGIGVIDALPPFNTYGGMDQDVYVSPHNNPNTEHDESTTQPASVSIWKYTDKNHITHPSLDRDGDDFVYDSMTSAGYSEEPEEAFAYSHFMVFGPYNLLPGEKAKVVVAYVGGMGSGAPKYSDYKRYGQPFNFEWLNLGDGVGYPSASFRERQKDIPLGEDVMFDNFQKAIDVYGWGYDTPNQPPNIKTSYESNAESQTVIKWSSFGERAQDPDYDGAEAQDLRGYRIYRSELENQGPWEMVAEVSLTDIQAGVQTSSVRFNPTETFHTIPSNWRAGGGRISDTRFPLGIPLKENAYMSGMDSNAGDEIEGLYRFTDVSSRFLGQYWYSVRYYDAGHNDWKGTGVSVPVLESSGSPSGGTLIGDTWGVAPILGGSEVFDRLEAKVQVVPNIFKADTDLHTQRRSEILVFQNLPARAMVEIFDVSGGRVVEEFHNSVDDGILVWNQETFNGINATAPGIYFWKVTSLMPESMGKSQKGTFLIIK